MTNPVFKAISIDLLNDLHKFGSVALPLAIIAVFYIAGAKLMDIKGYKRWPAIFAVLPIFWIFEGWLNNKPGEPKQTIHAMAALFCILNVGAFYLALNII